MTYYTMEETPEGYFFRRVDDMAPIPPVYAPQPVVIPPGVTVISHSDSSVTYTGSNTWRAGQIVAVRYKSGSVPPKGYFKLYGHTGGVVGLLMTLSLSESPGVMVTEQPTSTSTRNPQFNYGLINGVQYFPMKANTDYYLNIMALAAGTDEQYNFKVVGQLS